MSLPFLLMYLFGLLLFLIYAKPNEYEEYNIKRRGYNSITISYRPRIFALGIILVSVGLLCATRSMESYDTFVYAPWYEKIQSIGLFQIDGAYGILFELFAKIVAKIFHGGYQVFFFLVSSFNLIAVYKAIMRDEMQRETAMLSYLFYLTFIGFYYSFIVLRQGLAITMVIMAYCELDRSKRKALLLCIAGALFHESAIIAVLCVLLYKSKFRLNRVAAYSLIVISLFFYVTHVTARFIVPILQSILNILNRIDAFTFHKYILYFSQDSFTDNVSILYVFYYLLTIILVHFIYRKHGEEMMEERDRFFININVIGLAIIGFFSATGAITRLAEYMVTCTYILLIPKLLRRITNWRDTKLISAVIMTVMIVLHLRIILGPIDLYL